MRTSGSGCITLFALPFAAVGVGMSVWMGWTALTALAMRQWEEVPARIVSTDLETQHGGKGDTHQVIAEYEYTYGGRSYTGHRVGLNGGADNVSSFQRDTYRELSQYQKSRRLFRCYVNPQQPESSILYRDLRWEMLAFQSAFALAFGSVGCGLLIFGWSGHRRTRTEKALAAAHPQEPWLQKSDWADGRITSSSRTAMRIWLAIAVYWNLVSLPLWLVLPGEILGKGNKYALIGLVVPAVGMALIAAAVAALRRWWKFGQSVFQMAAVPGLIGGQLAGVIRTAAKVLPEDGFQLRLSCVQKVTTGSGEDRSTREEILWQDDQVIQRDLLQSDPDHSAIPVLFAIPYECRPCDETKADHETLWRLEARAKLPGLSYRATFNVPVFKTDQSDPNFQLDPAAMAGYTVPPDPQRDLREAGVVKTLAPSGDGFQFVFPRGRNLGTTVGLGLFAAVWTGVVVVLFHVKAPLLFPIAFGLFDVLILAALADLLFYSSTVEASPGGLMLCSGWWGLGRSRRLEAADVAKIEPVAGMQSGPTVYYNIVVTDGHGKRITAAKNVVSHRLATAVIAQIQQAMGRDVSAPGPAQVARTAMALDAASE